MTTFPSDYIERVYAGVLGKIIGVYLGRPFEGWSYQLISERLGEIWYYVHDKLNTPLIVTDDDISGTFTFLRALPDYSYDSDLTPAQIGQTWLNYLIEEKTILWWGGIYNSTEHTAYLHLKKGIKAPHSGSIATNGKIVAEQIGAQIFIDGWAMVAPGDPALAADLARRAGSVSHDGEAIYGAQVLAAMEALAFVENDRDKLLDVGVSYIPQDSIIYRMIAEIRDQHAKESNWHKTRQWIEQHYGYDKYIGNCHMVPNHALIILGLLYGDDDFQKSLMIANTSGWDTDCNSGNLGCLLGIKNGLAGIDNSPVDWRGPVADRMYIVAADGGRAVTDAVQETYHLVNTARGLAGETPLRPKNGARFHFELLGSLQSFFVAADGQGCLQNVAGHSQSGSRSLAIRAEQATAEQPLQALTPTFIPPQDLNMPGYRLMACPTLYSGQTVTAQVAAAAENTAAVPLRFMLNAYSADDTLVPCHGPQLLLAPGETGTLEWQVPEMTGMPIAEIGLELAQPGTVYLDSLGWHGTPRVALTRPSHNGANRPKVWRQAWVQAMDQWEGWWHDAYRLVQNNGRGLIIQGTREWQDYQVSLDLYPTMMKAGGVAARFQGMRRYYALLLCADGFARLVKVLDDETVLAETELDWPSYTATPLALAVEGNRLKGWVDGRLLFDLTDDDQPLLDGAIALVCEEGHWRTDRVEVRPI